MTGPAAVLVPALVPALVAALVAGVAAGLLVPPACAVPPGQRGAGGGLRGRRWGPAGAVVAAVVTVAVAVVAALPPRRAVLALVLLGVAASAVRQRRRQRRRRAAARERDRVLEVCEELAAELGAGRTAAEALARAAHDWPALAPVAEADRLGGDVPTALRALARRPGAGDLVVLAASWQVAARTGQGLADALRRVALDLRGRRGLRRVVEGELASARATARLVAALPLAALALGSGAGAAPLVFLLDTPLGLACLAAGLGLGALGLAWIEAIAAGVDRDAG